MTRISFLASLVASAACAGEPLVPTFVEETGSSGVVSSYEGGWEYMVGGGVAAFDCSGDGFPDLAFAGGESPASLWRNVSAKGGPLRFEMKLPVIGSQIPWPEGNWVEVLLCS